MGSDIAVRVRNVKKDFYLPHHSSDSIKDSIVHMFQKKEKGSDTFHALKGVSFDIKKGEFFGILGRNGSGKSTLLKIISEIYQPTSGSVSHKGNLVAFIELGVGFKPQLTGRENVYLNGALLGFSKKEIDERYDEIVAFAELEDFMEQKLKNYSSGMKVRLAFAVAIQAQSDILVLDEVLAVGDASFQRKCYDYFKSLKEDKTKTIIFVTHSMGAVREYCDRAVLIEEGVVAHEGPADEIADEYLRLFSKDRANKSGAKNRWGNGDVALQSVEANVSKDKITIELKIKNTSHKLQDEVVVGMRIKDQKGKLVAGGGTLNYLNGETLTFKEGETKKLIYTMPKTIFGGGVKTVGASVVTSDQRTTFDRWDDAAEFIIGGKESYYPVILPAEFSITSLSS